MELELEPFNLPCDNERPFVIAGPCSAETEEQVMTTAKQLADKGCHMFRAGVWKPRTKPGGFEGNGEAALPWLKAVKEETGMLIATEVATPEHVELCLKYGVDILWVGARTTANPFAMQALADSMKGIDNPVFVKNPVNPDLELWIGGMERINQAGVKHMAAIHRGFSSYDKKIYRNLPMWQIPIELRRRIPTSLSSATQATSVVAASLSHHYASRLWTLASMVLSLRAIATQIVHGAMLSSRLHQMSSTTSSASFRCAANQ